MNTICQEGEARGRNHPAREQNRRERHAWFRTTALAAAALVIALLTVTPVLVSPAAAAARSTISQNQPAESTALLAPPRQSATSTPVPEQGSRSGDGMDANQIATAAAVLNRHGAAGAENLAMVTAVNVENLQSRPELVFDLRAEQAAVATEVARSVQATVEANAKTVAIAAEATASAAMTATANAESQEAEALSAAASAADETATASASATETAMSVSATKEAEALALAAVATATAEAQAAADAEAIALAVAARDQSLARGKALLLLALILVLGGILGVTLWRRGKEPFVLKANLATS